MLKTHTVRTTMRSRFVFPVVIAALLPATLLAADQSDLARIDATWNTLRLNADVDGLDKLLADDWLLTHSDGQVQTKVGYLTELSSRSRKNQAIANEDVRLRLYGNTGVVTGTSVQSGVSDGKPWSGRFRFTRVWVQRDGAWVMVASHSSRVAPPP